MSEFFDTNNDRVADAVRFDGNGDGYFDAIGFDRDQNGVFEAIAYDPDGDGDAEAIFVDADQDGLAEAALVDQNNDGVLETSVRDTNRDGLLDTVQAPRDISDLRNEIGQATVVGPATNLDPVAALVLELAERTGRPAFGEPDSDSDGYVDSQDHRPSDPYRH